MKLILVVLASLIFSSSAWAYGEGGVLLGLSTNFWNKTTEGVNLGETDVQTMFADVRFGYLSDSLYLGAMYSSFTVKSGGDVKRTGYGATIGLHSSGYFADLTYFPMAEYEASAGGVTVTLGKGNGLGVDIGYNTRLTESFYGGFQISYRTWTFTETKTLGVTTVTENKINSDLYPMLNIGFMF